MIKLLFSFIHSLEHFSFNNFSRTIIQPVAEPSTAGIERIAVGRVAVERRSLVELKINC